MGLSAVGSVIPDYGTALSRPRVVGKIGRFGNRPTILFGPSGCGKTVAAAEFAKRCGKPVVWVDSRGQGAALVHVTRSLRQALGEKSASSGDYSCQTELRMGEMIDLLEECARVWESSDEFCLVIDDVGSISEEDAQGFHLMAKSLIRLSCRVIVTTTSLKRWPPDVLRDCEIVGAHDLNLTVSEATELLRTYSAESTDDDAIRLWEISRGHVALFAVLSAQAENHGLESAVRRTPTLDAWLESYFSQLNLVPLGTFLTVVLLKSGSEEDLADLGGRETMQRLAKLSEALPLVTTIQVEGRIAAFRVHDLVDGFWADQWQSIEPVLRERACKTAAAILLRRGDFTRVAEILVRERDQFSLVRCLTDHGAEMLRQGLFTELRRLMNATTIASLMARPRLLLLWADLSAETGCLEDALAKTRAARPLAEHDGDYQTASMAVARSLLYLRRMNRFEEAENEADRILASPQSTVLLTAEALFCVGHNAVLAGRWKVARPALQSAYDMAVTAADGVQLGWAARQALVMLPALAEGDFVTTSRELSPMIAGHGHPLCFRTALKGNLAVCLLESGRLSRCESLLRSVLDDAENWGLTEYRGAYLPVLGCAEIGESSFLGGLSRLRDGIELAISAGDECGADQGRVYLAVVLRAAGSLDESLCEAERAFERLSVADSMNFRRLAALEVAASLLALGDSAAARSWVGIVLDEGFSGNLYHALRAEMILAEIDRREGRLDQAIERLRGHADYILSENPSWQIAMYCRAFPALLGVFGLAVGVERLPAHMLRMILPEHAERCLEDSRAFMGGDTWSLLGMRLLGKEEFEAYVRRDGLPLCHVRLFGGLDVSVGGRSVRERDWKKRKARLLFAMLVIRRGQDVARDQLFEYLWPEMDEERAKNNLYVVWSAMKSVLMGKGERGGKCPYVESVGGVCRSVRETVRTDVNDFQTAIVAARDAETDKNSVDALRAYERIADLYRGDLLPGDCYDDWFANLREHYRSEFVDAMLRATQLLMDADDPGNALIFSRRAIQCDPFREDLYQAALRCQIAAGQRSSAIDTYLQCRDRLADELGLDPSVETRALYDEILAMEDKPRPTPIDPLVG